MSSSAHRRYRPEILTSLEAFGIRPHDHTDPHPIRELLNELYTLELRRLKAELVEEERRRGRKQRRQYSERVRELREKYALLSRPTQTWLAAPDS